MPAADGRDSRIPGGGAPVASVELVVLLALARLEQGSPRPCPRPETPGARAHPMGVLQEQLGVEWRTGANGRFAFRLDDPESFNRMAAEYVMKVPEGCLRVLKPGFAGRATGGARAGRRLDWPAPIVLRLGELTLTLGGRVLDSRGQPLALAPRHRPACGSEPRPPAASSLRASRSALGSCW